MPLAPQKLPTLTWGLYRTDGGLSAIKRTPQRFRSGCKRLGSSLKLCNFLHTEQLRVLEGTKQNAAPHAGFEPSMYNPWATFRDES